MLTTQFQVGDTAVAANPLASVDAFNIPPLADADRARKHGLDEFVLASPANFPHDELFARVQSLTLEFRLSDPYVSFGWLSPGQIFILDEYASRYGVRGCHRHLCYLSDLLDRAENGIMIDPTLMHYSFAFCASHVHGNRPDGIGTVMNREREMFEIVKERLRALLEKQITEFRYYFPFGRPESALKGTLSLLERVSGLEPSTLRVVCRLVTAAPEKRV